MAALLHDTVDDTRVSLEEIYDQFGPRVAQIVGQVGQLSTTTQLLRRRRRTDVGTSPLLPFPVSFDAQYRRIAMHVRTDLS